MLSRRISRLVKPSLQYLSHYSKPSSASSSSSSQIVLSQCQRRGIASRAGQFTQGLTGKKGQAFSLAPYSRSAYLLRENAKMVPAAPTLYRSFASTSASEPRGPKQSEGKKAISTVEDPFDSPTYHIPEKPVTFTEGASYTFIILAGLGVAGAAVYGVCNELIFQPKEYKIFDKALDRVQNDSQVKVRIGSPIKGYGQDSHNRAARQRIPRRIWTDQDGVEHIEINFYISGPHGGGKVFCEMFKDKTDNQWKYMFLVVDIKKPSQAQLMLESYIPS